MFHRLMILTLAIALAVGTGCGGGGETEPLTKSEFTKQANQICTKSGEEIRNRLTTFVKDQPNEGAGMSRHELFVKAMETVLLPLTEAKADQIEALAAPAGDEKEIEAYLARLNAGISAISKQKSESFAALKGSLLGFEEALAPSRKLAVAYGMKEC